MNFDSADTKVIIGAVSAVLAFVAYGGYLRDIFRGKTEPHAFTWLIWMLVAVIVSAGQIASNGGAGSWSVAVTAVLSLAICVLAFMRVDQKIATSDWWCLFIALGAIPLWIFTNTPLWSMLLVSLIDVIGFIPTFRKGYYYPFTESISTFSLGVVISILSIFAMGSYSLTTLIFPAVIIMTNCLFIPMLLIRRRVLK